MNKLLNVLLMVLVLGTLAWGANSIGSILTADLGSGTASNASFLRGDKTWSHEMVGPFNVTGLATAGDLAISNTGGTGHFLKQSSAGGNVSSSVLAASDIPNPLNATTFNGAIAATTLNVTTAGVAANASTGTGQAEFATNSTGGTGQPANTTQAVWVAIKVDGVTTYVAGFR